jgi:hypothetical protein
VKFLIAAFISTIFAIAMSALISVIAGVMVFVIMGFWIHLGLIVLEQEHKI